MPKKHKFINPSVIPLCKKICLSITNSRVHVLLTFFSLALDPINVLPIDRNSVPLNPTNMFSTMHDITVTQKLTNITFCPKIVNFAVFTTKDDLSMV